MTAALTALVLAFAVVTLIPTVWRVFYAFSDMFAHLYEYLRCRR
jgi:hypothetical protein